MSVVRSFRLFAAAAVAVIMLVLFTGPVTPSTTARIARLEALIRCPSCEVLSVGQSTKPASLAIRQDIETRVHHGESDQAIVQSLTSRYGSSILLSPATSGVGVLLWLVPLGLVVFVGVGAVVFVRRRQ
jgi:cytochrome c-type biogenesis protein CcmH/NrfF